MMMPRQMSANPLTLMSVVLTVFLLAGLAAASAQAAARQAPFGDKVSGAIRNYNRATQFIATSGKFDPAAALELKALGFTAFLELRTPGENGTLMVKKAVETAGLTYFAIPVATRAPTEDQVLAFAEIVEKAANHPILVSCASANRVGAMWSLYRASKGVDAEVALEEGRTVGLKPSREGAVRERLGLPPLTQ